MGVVAASCCAAVVVWAGALSIVDMRQHRLPDVLTLPGALIVLLGAAICGRGVPALLGAVALGTLYLVIHLIHPAGLGGGDVKLAVALGGLTGALGSAVWVLAALGAPPLTGLVAMVAVLRRRGRAVPHGPSMCAASLLSAALAVL